MCFTLTCRLQPGNFKKNLKIKAMCVCNLFPKENSEASPPHTNFSDGEITPGGG